MQSSQAPLLSPNTEKLFWAFQAYGWSVLSVIAFISGPFWYGIHNLFMDIMVIILQSLTGMFSTLPLRILFRIIWSAPLYWRAIVSVLAATIAALLWTYVKMLIYVWVGFGGRNLNIWHEFGGWLYVTVPVIGGWSAFYYGIRYYREAEIERIQLEDAKNIAQEARFRELKAENLARDAQLLMLRYQINPHFLFNTLNTVCGLVSTHRGKEAQTMLVRLSDYFRHSLEADPYNAVSLAKELEIIGHYLDVERVRFGDRLNVEFSVDPEARDADVPSLILQPLFENAIKFSISENEGPSKILFKAQIHDDTLIIELRDQGPDLEAGGGNIATKGTGTGLRNVHERLKVLYGDQFNFSAKKTDTGGFEVKFSVPKNINLLGTT